MCTKLRMLLFLWAGVFSTLAQASGLQIEKFDAPFRVSKHSSVTEQAVLELFDKRCHDATGKHTTLDKTKALDNISGFIEAITIYDLAYLRCENWANQWELGVVLVGNGGSEWAVTVGEQWIVRVRAMSLEVKVLNKNELSILAIVHPTYCENVDDDCIKNFRFRKID